jgi:hypothetical protein
MSRILIAFTLLLWCSSASAQSSPWQLDERTTAGWTFTPGTALGGYWDSGLQPGGNPVVEGLFKKWIGLANPRAELDYNGRHSHVNFGYSGLLEKSWGTDLRWEQHSKFVARRTLTPHVDVSGDAYYSAVPTTDRLQLTDGVVPFAAVDSKWLSAGTSLRWRAGPRTHIFGTYRYQQVTLDDQSTSAVFPLRSLRDGQSQTPSLGFTRDLTSRLSTGATAEYRREHVSERGLDLGADYDIRTLTGEFGYQWSPSMALTGGAGVSQLRTDLLGLQDTSLTYHGGFDRRLRTFNVNGHFDHGLEQLYGFGTLGSTNTFSGGAFIPLADRLYYLSIVVAYSRSQPINDLGIGLDIRTLWTDATVGRQLTPWLRGEGYLGLAHQGTPGTDSIDRVRVGIQIVTSKPLRIQ